MRKIVSTILVAGLVGVAGVSADMDNMSRKEMKSEHKMEKSELKKEYKEKMGEMKMKNKEERKEMRAEYKEKRFELRMKYRKKIAEKLKNKLNKIPTEKLEKIVKLIDSRIAKFEASKILTDIRRERLIAVYSALKDVINDKLNSVSEDDIINDILK